MKLKAKGTAITVIAAAALAGVAVTVGVVTQNVKSETGSTDDTAVISTATPTEAETEPPTVETAVEASSAAETISQSLSVASLSGLEVTGVTDTSVDLKWNTAEGAQSYTVYCRNAETNGDFEVCTATTESKYTVKELAGATEYEFKVAGYAESGNETCEGEPQSVTATTAMGSVSIELSAGYSSVSVKWSSASGADGYELYKSVNDGEYSLYKNLSADTTSLDDGDAEGGTKYAYKIRAVYKFADTTKYTDYSEASCVAAIAPLDFTLTNTGSKLTVSWDKSSANPDGYEVYYSTSEGSGYKLLVSTQDTSYTTEKLKLGTKYYFRLYAYKYCGQNDSEKYINECKVAGITIGGEPEETEPASTASSSSDSGKSDSSSKASSSSKSDSSSSSGGSDSYNSSNGETYIKVSISKQHMWFYKNGKLMVETDVVTGNYGTNDTPRGTYYILYKQSPAVLMLNSHVTYWLPFTYSGCGIHDSTWRSSYGGTIYKGGGSHGCVNTPYSAVKTIYNNVSAGTKVIVE